MAQALSEIEWRAADVTGLRSQMVSLWEELARQEEEPLSRVLALNLITVTDASHADELRRALDRMLLRHPCRAFAVVLDSEAAEIEAHLGARIRRLGGSRQTWLEEIALRASHADFAKLPGIIRPLIANDMPVHLFWATALPADTSRLGVMAAMADQTVINSCMFDDPARDLDRLGELPDLRFTDLAYFRQRPWRRALAAAFEHFEYDPGQPTDIVIARGPGCAASAATLLLANWLRDRLGAEIRFDDLPTGPEHEPSSLSLTHADVHVAIERLADPPRLRITISLGDRCLLPYDIPASRGELGDLLAAATDEG